MKNLYRFLFVLYTPCLFLLVIFTMFVIVIDDMMSRISIRLAKFIDLNTTVIVKLFMKK
jgi:hypothetical protein